MCFPINTFERLFLSHHFLCENILIQIFRPSKQLPLRGLVFREAILNRFATNQHIESQKKLSILMIPEIEARCPYSEFSWSIFSRILTEHGEYSVRMRENTDQKISEYGNFSRGENSTVTLTISHTKSLQKNLLEINSQQEVFSRMWSLFRNEWYYSYPNVIIIS